MQNLYIFSICCFVFKKRQGFNFKDLDPISEGEFLHRGPVDPSLLAAMAQITNQPVRIIEQILQQQNLLLQRTRSVLKGKKLG